MALYRVHFVDRGDNIYLIRDVEHQDDAEAIEATCRMNAPSVGARFEVWRDQRLVHGHRN